MDTDEEISQMLVGLPLNRYPRGEDPVAIEYKEIFLKNLVMLYLLRKN